LTFWRHNNIHAVWNSNLAWTSQSVLKHFNNRYIKNIIINDYSKCMNLTFTKTYFDILIVWSTDSVAIGVMYSARHTEIVFISSVKMFLIHYNAAKDCIHNTVIRRIYKLKVNIHSKTTDIYLYSPTYTLEMF
jgi:hypothetical protein